MSSPPPLPPDEDDRGDSPPRDRAARRSSRHRSGSRSRSPRSGSGHRYRERSRSRSPPRRDRPYRERSYSPDRGGRRGGGYYDDPPPRGYRDRDYPPPPRGGYYDRGPPPPPRDYRDRGPPMSMRGPPPGPPPRRGDRGREARRDEGPPGVSLLVRNVSPNITPHDLHQAFGRIGEIRDVYIPRDYHSQQPKGFAFIEYATTEQAKEARDEMDRFVIKGRALDVVFAQEKRKTPGEMRGRVVNQQNRGRERSNFDRSSSFERAKQREEDKESSKPEREEIDERKD